MSIFEVLEVACPACGLEQPFSVLHSVNADRRPDLREAILQGELQAETCGGCGAAFQLDPTLTYFDATHGLWVVARPWAERVEWAAEEERARAAFHLSFGREAPPSAQAIGRKLRARVTFGWAALREKVALAVAGVDDTSIELVKLALLRDGAVDGVSDDATLRLVALDAESLTFQFVNDATATGGDIFTVPRALLDAVGADSPEWAPLRAELGGLYVDVDRLFVEPTAAVG